MTPRELMMEQQAIERSIFDIAAREGLSTDGLDAIPDGVADCEAYLRSFPRVAWILKEPYDEKEESGAPAGGGWSMTECFNKQGQEWSVMTWQRVIYVMYGLRNGMHYSQIISEDINRIGPVVKEIAWLNLSKMPAGTTSGDRNYIKAYRQFWKPVLKRQVNLYAPEVMIFGNTLSVCAKDFEIEGNDLIERVYSPKGQYFIAVYSKDGRLILNAFHPGFYSCDEQFYVDSIIDTINRYLFLLRP